MSVDEQKIEDTEELTDDGAQDLFEALLTGEIAEAEEPENSEQPEVVVGAEENQTIADNATVEPEPPVEEVSTETEAEGQEQSALPDWAEGLDQSNQKIVDATNYYDKGEFVEWMSKGTDKMEPEELEAFKEVQRARQKFRNEQKQQVDPEIERQEKLKSEAWDKIDQILHPEKFTEEPEPQDQEPDIEAQIAELVEEGDTAAVMKLMQSTLDKKLEKGLSQKLGEIKNELKAELSNDARAKTKEDYYQTVDTFGNELADNDPRFERMLETGADGMNAFERIYSLGMVNGEPVREVRNPRTGELIIGWQNAKEDTQRVYDYYLSGFKTSSRPELSAQPPSGSIEGASPLVTKEDLENEDFVDYMNEGLKKLGL